jgi:hypothetical protein
MSKLERAFTDVWNAQEEVTTALKCNDMCRFSFLHQLQGGLRINIMHMGRGDEKLIKIFGGPFFMVVGDKFEYKYN